MAVDVGVVEWPHDVLVHPSVGGEIESFGDEDGPKDGFEAVGQLLQQESDASRKSKDVVWAPSPWEV